MKTKVQVLENEISKRDKIKNQSSGPSQQQITSMTFCNALKKQVKELKESMRIKDDELIKLRKEMKSTKILELENEVKVYHEECLRMRRILEDTVRSNLANHGQNLAVRMEKELQVKDELVNELKGENTELALAYTRKEEEAVRAEEERKDLAERNEKLKKGVAEGRRAKKALREREKETLKLRLENKELKSNDEKEQRIQDLLKKNRRFAGDLEMKNQELIEARRKLEYREREVDELRKRIQGMARTSSPGVLKPGSGNGRSREDKQERLSSAKKGEKDASIDSRRSAGVGKQGSQGGGKDDPTYIKREINSASDQKKDEEQANSADKRPQVIREKSPSRDSGYGRTLDKPLESFGHSELSYQPSNSEAKLAAENMSKESEEGKQEERKEMPDGSEGRVLERKPSLPYKDVKSEDVERITLHLRLMMHSKNYNLEDLLKLLFQNSEQLDYQTLRTELGSFIEYERERELTKLACFLLIGNPQNEASIENVRTRFGVLLGNQFAHFTEFDVVRIKNRLKEKLAACKMTLEEALKLEDVNLSGKLQHESFLECFENIGVELTNEMREFSLFVTFEKTRLLSELNYGNETED